MWLKVNEVGNRASSLRAALEFFSGLADAVLPSDLAISTSTQHKIPLQMNMSLGIRNHATHCHVCTYLYLSD